MDADGFQQPRRGNRRRRQRQEAAPSPPSQRPRSPSPEEAAELSFCCLDHRYHVRDCTNDIRCRRCLISGHDSCSYEGRRRDAARGQPHHGPGRANPAAPVAALLPPPPTTAPAAPVPTAHSAEPARVIMSRSIEMEEAEEVLSRAMVASITGTRPHVSADEVAAVLFDSLELFDGDFTVHTRHPEDFLILFSS